MIGIVTLAFLVACTSALQLQRYPDHSVDKPIEMHRSSRPPADAPQLMEILRQQELKEGNNCDGKPHYTTGVADKSTKQLYKALNPDTLAKDSKPVKLVLGIHTLTESVELQEAHRNTWMKAPGVCTVDQWNDPSCHTFPVFLFANISGTQFASLASAKDAVMLEYVPERPGGNAISMNLKTIAWLDYASKNFKWATHVGKMDLDTYPYLQCIQNDLSEGQFKDYPTFYGLFRHPPPPSYSKETGLMTGDFNVMSNTLAGCLSQYNAEHAVSKDDESFKKYPKWFQEWMISSNAKIADDWVFQGEDQVVTVMLNRAADAKVCPAWVKFGADYDWKTIDATPRWKHGADLSLVN